MNAASGRPAEERRIVSAALDLARELGFEVDRYDVRAESTSRGWNVNFHRLPQEGKPNPGDFFTIIERDGALCVVPGK
jgi:hypothetical protein